MNSQIITAYKLLKILSLSGITDVCYAPGSRSAPLVLALNMLNSGKTLRRREKSGSLYHLWQCRG